MTVFIGASPVLKSHYFFPFPVKRIPCPSLTFFLLNKWPKLIYFNISNSCRNFRLTNNSRFLSDGTQNRIRADFQYARNIPNPWTVKCYLNYQSFCISQISLVGIASEKLFAAIFAPIPLFFWRVVPFFLMFSDEQLGQVITSYCINWRIACSSQLFISASLLKHDRKVYDIIGAVNTVIAVLVVMLASEQILRKQQELQISKPVWL